MMANDSLMVPTEREAYGKGGALAKIIRALSPKQSDEIPEVFGEQHPDGILWKPEGEKVIKADIERAKKAIVIPPKGRKIYERPFIPRTYFSMTEGRSGTQILLQEDIPEGSEAFRQKFVTTWRRDGKTFTHNGEKYIVAKGEAERMKKNTGSLMVPPEREGYGKGSLVKSVLSALSKKSDAPKQTDTKIDPEIQKEVEKVIDELEFVASPEPDGITKEGMKEEFKEWIQRKPKTNIQGGKYYDIDSFADDYDLTDPQEFFWALDDKIISMQEGNNGKIITKKSRAILKEIQDGLNNDSFKRDSKNKGGAILDLVAAITGKQTKAAKKKMVSEEKAVQDLEKILDNDPRALDDLSDEDYETVVSKLPQRQAAKLGMGDEPLDDMVEIARGMEPAEVAKNLEMFNDIDEIFEYADTLDAKGARQFMQNLSDEDLEIFGADLPDVGSSLGPREVKAHGGVSGVAILMPAEYNEKPKDTYDNISPEEKKQQEKDMLPDDEMEDEYIDYVAEKILTEDEQEYLFKALDDNDRLEKILDKIILDATEFTGSGEVEGPGTGISDSIPARLSDGEFVFTRKAVDQIGADKLQKMMDDAEREFDQRQGKAQGGMYEADLFNQPQQIEATGYEMANKMEDPVIQQQRDIGRQMMYSSKVPSLLNR